MFEALHGVDVGSTTTSKLAGTTMYKSLLGDVLALKRAVVVYVSTFRTVYSVFSWTGVKPDMYHGHGAGAAKPFFRKKYPQKVIGGAGAGQGRPRPLVGTIVLVGKYTNILVKSEKIEIICQFIWVGKFTPPPPKKKIFSPLLKIMTTPPSEIRKLYRKLLEAVFDKTNFMASMLSTCFYSLFTGFPSDEAEEEERFELRQRVAPDLFWGYFENNRLIGVSHVIIYFISVFNVFLNVLSCVWLF